VREVVEFGVEGSLCGHGGQRRRHHIPGGMQHPSSAAIDTKGAGQGIFKGACVSVPVGVDPDVLGVGTVGHEEVADGGGVGGVGPDQLRHVRHRQVLAVRGVARVRHLRSVSRAPRPSGWGRGKGGKGRGLTALKTASKRARRSGSWRSANVTLIVSLSETGAPRTQSSPAHNRGCARCQESRRVGGEVGLIRLTSELGDAVARADAGLAIEVGLEQRGAFGLVHHG
jgi:hypothetical protein